MVTELNEAIPEPAAPRAPGRLARSRQVWLTVIIAALALWIASPFLTPIAWAGVLAIAEWPLCRWISARYPRPRGLGAVVCTLATALLVVLPLSLIASSLVIESQNAIAWLAQVQQFGLKQPEWLGGIPVLGGRLSVWWNAHVATPQAARDLLGSAPAGSMLGWARAIAGEVAKESGVFLVTLVALLSLLISGEQIAAQSRATAARLFGTFGLDFLGRLTLAVRRTVVGTVLVSVIEGSLIGVGYIVAGVPQPLLFAVATIVLALVPFGAWLVFGVAGLVLIGQGHVLAGGLLVGYSIAVMTIGDNFVQPAVIGGSVELPFLLAFVGAFGGLAAMGLVGLFVGPVVMVALLLIWREWAASDPPTAPA